MRFRCTSLLNMFLLPQLSRTITLAPSYLPQHLHHPQAALVTLASHVIRTAIIQQRRLLIIHLLLPYPWTLDFSPH